MLSSFSSSFSFGKMTKAFLSPYENALLVLDLDAINYEGIGTKWEDLSIYDNDAFAVNHTPRFTANNQFYFSLVSDKIVDVYQDEFIPSSNTGGGIGFPGSNTSNTSTEEANTSLFDSTEHFSILDDNSLDIENEITFEMWFNLNNLQGSDPIALFSKVENVANTNVGYYGYVNNNGYTFSMGNSANNQILSYPTTPSIDVWQHLVTTISNNGSIIYINGVEVANSEYVATENPSNNNSLLVGSAVYGDFGNANPDIYSFGGNLAAFRIYNGTLTPSEVLSNFNEKKSRFGL